MGVVKYVERDEAAEPLQPVYDSVTKKLGFVLNFFKAMAHNPTLLQGFMGLNAFMNKTSLDPKLRELAFLKTSDINGCDYCLHYHRKSGTAAGLSESQLSAVTQFETSDAFDDLQKDVLRFAEQVTRTCKADDALVSRLRERGLGDREIVELTATVALASFTNRVNETLKIDLP